MTTPKALRHTNILFLFRGVLFIRIRPKKHLRKYGCFLSPLESIPKKSDWYAKYIQKVQNRLPKNQKTIRSTGDMIIPPIVLCIFSILNRFLCVNTQPRITAVIQRGENKNWSPFTSVPDAPSDQWILPRAKKCPPDTFYLALRRGRPFESRIRWQKEKPHHMV